MSTRAGRLRGTAAITALSAALLGFAAGGAPAGETAVVIVRARTTTTAVAADVAALGGQVNHVLDAVGMVTATLPADRIATLETDPDVADVSRDRSVSFSTSDSTSGSTSDSVDFTDGTPVEAVAKAIGADALHQNGFTGEGIDVAIIDTGIADSDALAGRVKKGIDLSFDAFAEARLFKDQVGHGTHLAGIIAADGPTMRGIAPGAGLVNVKVGDRNGVADVTQVIAAVDWVIQNRSTSGRNIRVLNLAFGTDSTLRYQDDPMAYAIEAAYRNGIVPVVSAGNRGTTSDRLDMPAMHPAALAVGASEMNGTIDLSDDTATAYTSTGSRTRSPSGVAPGSRILSLRVPGSLLDNQFPSARASETLFRGSGTSQSAAVMSGAVALLLQAQPAWGPADVHAALRETAVPIQGATTRVGPGAFEISSLPRWNPRPRLRHPFEAATGTGPLDGSRGSNRVTLHAANARKSEIKGDIDWTGAKWKPGQWAGSSWNGSSWNGSSWNGSSWNASSWNGAIWGS